MDAITNKVELSWFAGADAEIKNLSGKQMLAKVQLAVNDSYTTSSGQEVKKTQWFTLTFWGAKAELAEKIVKKGTQISIEGRLLNNFYKAKDGSKRYSIEIVVSEIYWKEQKLTNQKLNKSSNNLLISHPEKMSTALKNGALPVTKVGHYNFIEVPM